MTRRSVVAVKTNGGTRTERRDLPAGLVEISPTTPNIQSLRDLATITGEALEAVGVRRETLALALPDRTVVTAVYPDRAKASERDLRRELVSSVPFPASDARCDFWRGRRGEVLAAAVREAVVRQYEQIVETAECRLGWVDGVSLCGIPEWSARKARPDQLDVVAQIYREHYFLTVFRGGELVDARMKLRNPGEMESIGRELLRVPALHDSDHVDSLFLYGADAGLVAAALEGNPDIDTVVVPIDGEDRHLEASIETLLARGEP